MSEFPPLIYVDLIKDQPLPREEYVPDHRVETKGEWDAAYRQYVERFQPFRLLVKSGDNQEPLFRSTEAYFNKADAIHAAHLAFGSGSNVYLRQHEKGNQNLRMAAR